MGIAPKKRSPLYGHVKRPTSQSKSGAKKNNKPEYFSYLIINQSPLFIKKKINTLNLASSKKCSENGNSKIVCQNYQK